MTGGLVPAAQSSRWVDLVQPAAALARSIADTDFVPEAMRHNPAQITACILYGDEIGLGPMQALAKINVIKGRPAPSAELGRALALAHGHEVWIEDASNTRVTVAGRRRGSDVVQRVTWTLDDVKRAGLGGVQYQRYPRQMLLARASAELVRQMCPDALGGITLFAEEIGGDEVAVAAEIAPAPAKVTRARKRPVAEPGPEPEPGPGPESVPEPEPEPGLGPEPELVANTLEPVGVEQVTDDGRSATVLTFPDNDAELTPSQSKAMRAMFTGLGLTEKSDQLSVIRSVIGHEITKKLTRSEAAAVLDALIAVDENRAEVVYDDGEVKVVFK